MSKRSPKARVRDQYGAAPYRIGPNGGLQVLLVTTRETHRWMVPKGWPIKELGALGTAMREAYEEAGVRGDGGPALGSFKLPQDHAQGSEPDLRGRSVPAARPRGTRGLA
ncbi:NUDIX hydrolase [Chenggangzhangella methanolivorans]|uniref:NUDIX hydrolase n=1 Tax=Chenggangzhangella methanolivorans TaxID=1437009 RepID=UPI0021BD1BA8|nr:hypothetical protein [Chenggangzhangella methanolivorans]